MAIHLKQFMDFLKMYDLCKILHLHVVVLLKMFLLTNITVIDTHLLRTTGVNNIILYTRYFKYNKDNYFGSGDIFI